MEYVVQTAELTKKFGSRLAVDHVSMNIRKGEIYGLIGRNGAGKTTLMRILNGLAFPTSGEVRLFEERQKPEQGHRIGSLIEAPGLFKGCTARENLMRYAILYNADVSQIDNLLRIVGLDHTGRKKAGKFSLGMKQRLGIAIALLGSPELLILDEPTNGLDPAGIMDVRNLLLTLNRELGITILISSHLLDELAKVVTRYGILNQGRLVEEISAEELQNRFTRRLVITVDDPVRAADIIRTHYERAEAETRAAFICAGNTDAAVPQATEGIPAMDAPQVTEGIPAMDAPQVTEGIPAMDAPQAAEGIPAMDAPQVTEGIPVLDAPQVTEGIPVLDAQQVPAASAAMDTSVPENTDPAMGMLYGGSRIDFMINGNQLIFRDHIEDRGKLNRILNQEGVEVSGIEMYNDSPEQYFVERMGR